MGEAGKSREQGSEASKLRSGEAVGRLAGGACRLSQQAQEAGASVGKGRKLSRVADALREGDYGGAASKQARKLPAAARPASSPSKARNTREQLGKLAATRSMPWVPRAAQTGRPHWVKARQSNRPSATTTQDGAGSSRPSPSTGLGPVPGHVPIG